MYQSDREDTTIYKVVVNHEEQYSISPEEKQNPLGWKVDPIASNIHPCLDKPFAFFGHIWVGW